MNASSASESLPPARTLLLVAAAVAAWALALEPLTSAGLPGCGAESACADVVGSEWGRLPLLGWPVSLFGAAWFTGLLGAWLVGRGRLGDLRPLVRLGAAGSLFYLGVMLVATGLCPWCLAVHVAHLAFVTLEERRPPTSAPRVRASFGGILVAVTAGLVALHTRQESGRDERAEEELARSLDELGGAAPADGAFTGRYPEGPSLAHEMRYPGGDCTSDIWI